MPSPLDIQLLANRIERLQQVHTHDWDSCDELEFKNILPGGRGRLALPDPKTLRKLVDDNESLDVVPWMLWVAMTVRLESMIQSNDPRNPQRMIRDMMQGKGLAGWRR